jgi:hypothetical protein
MVCIARMAILDAAITLSMSRRHRDGCVLSNAKKMGGVVDLGAYRVPISSLSLIAYRLAHGGPNTYLRAPILGTLLTYGWSSCLDNFNQSYTMPTHG